MNIKKNIVILTILGATSLFAADLKGIATLVDKINNTKALEVKQELMINLNKEVESLNKIDVIEAQDFIDKNLKK
ncbi:MAG: hypothetical protein WA945_11520 [Arcobacteraceae bacterium]